MTRKSRPSEEEVSRQLPTIARQVLGDYQKVAKLAQEASSTKKWRARQTAKTVTLMVLAACPPLVIAVPASLLAGQLPTRRPAPARARPVITPSAPGIPNCAGGSA